MIAGTDRYRAYQGSYTEQAVSIFFDSSFSNSELDTDEANVLLYDSESSYGQSTVLSSIDFDGDGYSDVIYGDWNGQSASFNGNLSSTGESFMYFFSGANLNDGDVLDLSGDSDFYLTGPDDFDYRASGLGGGDYNNDGYDDIISFRLAKTPMESLSPDVSMWSMVKMDSMDKEPV